MAAYETLREETRRFGDSSYLEVARKRLVEHEQATEFLLVTRGFVDKDGGKRWTRFVTLPDDAELRGWLCATLETI